MLEQNEKQYHLPVVMKAFYPGEVQDVEDDEDEDEDEEDYEVEG